MVDWKDKICGSKVLPPSEEEGQTSIQKLLGSNEILSCGGGFFPAVVNAANMKTFRNSFILPTSKYSVLVFKEDGNAVIYSEDEEVGGTASQEENNEV